MGENIRHQLENSISPLLEPELIAEAKSVSVRVIKTRQNKHGGAVGELFCVRNNRKRHIRVPLSSVMCKLRQWVLISWSPSVLHAPSHTISHLHQSPNRSQVLGHSGKLFFYISFSGDLISQPNWFRFGGERKYPDMTETHLVCLFILRKPSDKNDIDTFMFFGRVVCDTPRRMAKNF